ncbi:MAG: alpha/beta fold hydrolase [Deltaproteobacteria bacterium]|nr:alpha/beta fold hydrolase [Deltaproteobacteria bacterium]
MSLINRRLFVHGWATDSGVWDSVATASDLTLDLPGHGEVGRWDEPCLSPAVDAIKALLAGRAPRSVVGIGWSLGGQSLIEAAAQLSQLGAIVLVSATPKFIASDDFPWGRSKALVRRMIMDMKRDARAALKRFYGLNFTGSELCGKEATAFMTRYETMNSGWSPGDVTTALEALYKVDLRPVLNKIDIPCLVMHGERDDVTPIGAARFLAENIRGARLSIFENAGHAPFITNRERFMRELDDFVAKT